MNWAKMAEKYWMVRIEDMPLHLIMEILSCRRLSSIDLLSFELSSEMFSRAQARTPSLSKKEKEKKN